ncbi:MAG TPA: diacylglycerol kinase family protein [Vicinamibacterales bacterium]|nr:diacylglycerol kinase family protein [Vicinamibacterales bacterium]
MAVSPAASATFIINPIAGGGTVGAAEGNARLALSIAEGFSVPSEVFVTTHVGHARELAKAAAGRGTRVVMAWGGDGTINEVASALVGSDVALGIVPAGSGNGLARELGIVPRPRQAIADALHARPRSIDVGELEGRYFVNTAGIGFDAHIASRFATARRRGFLGYVGITAHALTSYVPRHYRVSVAGGAPQRVRAVLLTIANSAQFGNGAIIAPGARVDDGELDLVIFEERSRFRTVCALPRLFNGTADRISGCRITRLREVVVDADAPLTFHVDGEPVAGGTTLRARVHPGALCVAVN